MGKLVNGRLYWRPFFHPDMNRDNFNIIGFIQFVMFVATRAYHSGAPVDACGKMSPSHGYSKQEIHCPYTISVSSSSYYPGETISVTVSGPDPFKGIILQARRVDRSEKNKNPEGSFRQLPETLQYITCNNLTNSTVTHTNSTEKQQIQVDWVAPAEYIGKIKFYATIAYNLSVYWVKEKSDVVKGLPIDIGTPSTDITSTNLISETGTSGYLTTEYGNATDKYFATSPPNDLSNVTIVTLEDSMPNNTSLFNNSHGTIIVTEIITSSNDTELSTDIDVAEPTTLDQSLVTTEGITDQTKVISSAIPTLKTTTEDYTAIDLTTEIHSNSRTGNIEEIFSIPTLQTTDNNVSDKSALSNVTETTKNMYTTESKSTVNTTPDSLTGVITDTYTNNDSLTKNNSHLSESVATTTIRAAIEIQTESISIATNILDTSVMFKMTITSLEFIDSLANQSSNEFKELADDIRITIENVYSTWSGFQECRVVSFQSGSVVAETELIFETSLSDEQRSSAIGELYTLVEEHGGIGNYTVTDIQAVDSKGDYVPVDPCFLLPCPVDLNCYIEESRCILSCQENSVFCPNGDQCTVDASGKYLNCSDEVVKEPTSSNSKEILIAMVLIGASVFLIILVIILILFICKSWRKRRRRWRRRRQNQDVQLFGFEDNKHIRLNGGVANLSGTLGRYLVEVPEPTEAPFFSSHPTEPHFSGRGSIGSHVSQHSVFDRAFSSTAGSVLDEHDYDYDVINRSRSVTFIDTPQILGDEHSAEFGIENFSFGVPKYVDRKDDGGSYRVRWDFKVDDPATTDMDIAL